MFSHFLDLDPADYLWTIYLQLVGLCPYNLQIYKSNHLLLLLSYIGQFSPCLYLSHPTFKTFRLSVNMMEPSVCERYGTSERFRRHSDPLNLYT